MTPLVPGKQSVPPGYLEVLLIALVVAGITLFAYDRWFAPRVVAFDLKGYLRTQQALLASGEITEAQWQQGLDRLEQEDPMIEGCAGGHGDLPGQPGAQETGGEHHQGHHLFPAVQPPSAVTGCGVRVRGHF